jgi:small GTP-binding protein
VGKSSLILKYASQSVGLPRATVGVDILLKRLSHKGESYALELWDTAGHERYRTVVYNYFFHAQAAVVVFDLADEHSLEEARTWLQQITLYCGEAVPKMLLGNKSDLFAGEELAKTLEGYR